MPLGSNFKDTVKARLRESSRFRRELLRGAVESMVSGDVETGKLVLREYIEGTVGFLALGKALGKPSRSLVHMLGPRGNPQVRSLFQIVAHLQKVEGTVLQVHAVSAAA